MRWKSSYRKTSNAGCRGFSANIRYSTSFLKVTITHIIAGAVEVFTLAAMGEAAWPYVLGSYIVPTLIGNIIGGVTLVAGLNYAQVAGGGEQLDA